MSTATELVMNTYKVDTAHSRVGFVVRHMGFTKVRGSFEDFEATLEMDPGDLTTLQARAAIQVASIDTGDNSRDKHLRSSDFFDADTNPVIEFRSTGVENVRDDKFTLAGVLTMNGITKPVELDAEFQGEAEDPWGGTRVGFEARQVINRKEFGLNWNATLETGGLLVSEKVTLELAIQAVKQTDDDSN